MKLSGSVISDIESLIIAGLSAWEAAAILTGKIPTISHVLKALPIGPRLITVTGVAIWLPVHVELFHFNSFNKIIFQLRIKKDVK